MARFGMYFTTGASTYVEADVDLEGLEEEYTEDAILDALYAKLPTGLCVSCSGLGNEPGIDLGGDWDPDYDSMARVD